jgi:alpha-galactosidase
MGRPISEGSRTIENKDYKLQITIKKILHGWKITGSVQGKPSIIELAEFSTPSKIIYNNWQSWGPAMVMDADEKLDDLHSVRKTYSPWLFSPVPSLQEKFLVSDYVLAWEKGLAGFLTSKTAHPMFIRKGSSWTAALEYFGMDYKESIPLEPLIIFDGSPVEEQLDTYAEEIKEANQVVINPWNPVGWCSWYHYFRKIEWEDVVENLEEAGSFPFQVFQVDDGYQTEIGDWLSLRPGFPPLSEMAGLIQNAGFKPGIWTAPFSAAENSRLFNDHPDWMVSDSGKPRFCYTGWEQKIYALDMSNSKVKEWLFDIFHSLYQAGFEYFKIDFLFAAAMPGRRKRNISPVSAYREGLKVIREAVGGSFILGCGAPLLPSAGLVDGMRIGEDTAPFWRPEKSPFHGPNALHAIKNALMRQYMHRRLWINDPDCLLLRHKEIKLTENERELYARTSGALDNMLIDSDRLSFIGPRGRRILEEAIDLRGGNVRVTGIMDDILIIESTESPQGDFTLAVNLSDKDKLYASIPVPGRTAVFLDPLPEPSRGEGSIQ